MSTICDIEFENNPTKVVYAGKLLRGTVRLNLLDKINVRSLYVRISGKAFAGWQVNPKSYVQAKENCLDERVQLTGDVILEPETYKYPFEFMLPSNIPSSFEGTFGHIRYNVKVVFDVPVWLNKKFKEQFTLINAIDLNDDPSLRQPFIFDETKYLSPLLMTCFESNQIQIIARTPVRGYIPGQIIPLEIEINNQSNVEISKFTIELIKLITYFKQFNNCGCSSKSKKLEEISLSNKTAEGCGLNQDRLINIDTEIPNTLPTDNSICKTIKLTYYMRIKAVMPFLYKNLIIDLPLTIGFHPFHD